MGTGAVALVGLAGAVVGAVVTGMLGPLMLERRRARNESARVQIESIRDVRAGSLMWLGHLESTVTSLEQGRPVDADRFGEQSNEHFKELMKAKFSNVLLDGTGLLESLRLADRRVARDVAMQSPGRSVSSATHRALQEAFEVRAAVLPTLTRRMRALFTGLGG
ncbi:hypothetical protein [Streptomyces sp. NPDC056240]|uniref:hypothetical protein n=1 Tax=unclassified Streptomyces TaxID=2593676 RepID=UPI0035DF4FAA